MTLHDMVQSEGGNCKRIVQSLAKKSGLLLTLEMTVEQFLIAIDENLQSKNKVRDRFSKYRLHEFSVGESRFIDLSDPETDGHLTCFNNNNRFSNAVRAYSRRNGVNFHIEFCSTLSGAKITRLS